MPDRIVLHLLVDTSCLRGASFSDPDFRRLLEFSKQGAIRILVPHIVWEERRTQLAESSHTKLRKLREAVDALKAPWMGGLSIDGLVPQSLSVSTGSEIDTKSREMMAAFAIDNKIEIVPIAPDHADRAWVRYFNADLPFDPAEPRSDRRKDIPDSWIFETAIDLKRKHADLSALCDDGKLSRALASIGVTVFKKTPEVLDAINRTLIPELSAATERIETAEANAEDKLDAALTRARAPLKHLDKTVLGYVGYLGSPSKEQLFDLLARGGISRDVARNVAERLSFEGLIKDTGNHYLPENREACDLAASQVEPEIIKLLDT